MSDGRMTYASAGVDIAEGNRSVALFRDKVKSTFRPEVLGEIGGFAGAFSLAKFMTYQHPVLLSGTDGVGTKLKVAFETGILNTVGQDLVAMCVNDILTGGAEPLFFLDYYACSKIEAEKVAAVVAGIADGCIEAGCALVGGETAELPGFYRESEFDLAGFAVGIVDFPLLINGSSIEAGDRLIGLPSSGLHSNGFALVNKVVTSCGAKLSEQTPWGEELSLAEALLTPTRIYVKPILKLLEMLPPHTIKGMVNITGGGFLENIPRILPEKLAVHIAMGSWPVPAVFTWLQQEGNIAAEEMYRTFNNGIAFVLVVSAEDYDTVCSKLGDLGEEHFCIGEVAAGDRQVILQRKLS